MDSDDLPDNIVNLASVRKLRDFEKDSILAYVEILWGTETFAVNAAVQDLEALRRGKDPHDQPLRDPETTFEAEVLVKRLRWVTNYLAMKWDLGDMVRNEDWGDDVRTDAD